MIGIKKFNATQPRAPEGTPAGGQWVAGLGSHTWAGLDIHGNEVPRGPVFHAGGPRIAPPAPQPWTGADIGPKTIPVHFTEEPTDSWFLEHRDSINSQAFYARSHYFGKNASFFLNKNLRGGSFDSSSSEDRTTWLIDKDFAEASFQVQPGTMLMRGVTRDFSETLRVGDVFTDKG
nr:hypothetical protein [Gemmatimonadales bacterium]